MNTPNQTSAKGLNLRPRGDGCFTMHLGEMPLDWHCNAALAARINEVQERAVSNRETDLFGLLSETLQLLQEAAVGDSGDPEQDAYERDLYDRVLEATGGHPLRPRLPRVGDYVAFGSHHKHAGKVMAVDASGVTVSVPERHNGKCFFVTDAEGVILLHRGASPAKAETAENGGN